MFKREDDHEVVALLERIPTFSRDPKYLDELRKISDRKETRTVTTSQPKASILEEEDENKNNNVISF